MDRTNCYIYESDIEILNSDKFRQMLSDEIIQSGYLVDFLHNEDSIQDIIDESFDDTFYNSRIIMSSDYYNGSLYCTDIDCDADSDDIVKDIYKYIVPLYFDFDIIYDSFISIIHELCLGSSISYAESCLAYFIANCVDDFIQYDKKIILSDIDSFVNDVFYDQLDRHIADRDDDIPHHHNYMRI